MLCSLVTALSIRAACAGLLLPPVFCRGLAVKFISELSAPHKSFPPGAIWQIRPQEPTCSAEAESGRESRPRWGPRPRGGGLSSHQPRPVTLFLAFLIRLRMGALDMAAVPTHRTGCLPTLRTGLKTTSFQGSLPARCRRSWHQARAGVPQGKADAVVGMTIA